MNRPFLRALLPLVLAATFSCPSTAASEALPAWFEQNTGQYHPEVKFFSAGASGTLLVKQAEAVFLARGSSLRVRFAGSVTQQAVEGIDPTAVRGSRFVGNNPLRWQTMLQCFRAVRSRGIYRGIDIVYHLTQHNELEFDFTVAPGTDPRNVRLHYEAGTTPRLESSGDLAFANGVRQRRPAAYQETPRGRRIVEARYQVGRDGEVRFVLGRYDRSLPLVIDPVIYSGYVGGDRDDKAAAMAKDGAGNVWITGSSTSVVYAGNDPIQQDNKGSRDIFLAKLSPDSSRKFTVTYWTQLGGDGDDEARAIAIDPSGFVWLTGSTNSTNFPQAGVALQDAPGGGLDAFIVRIDPNQPGAGGLRYSVVYGGTAADAANAIAVDAGGAAYIAGYTASTTLTGILDEDGVINEQALQAYPRGGYDAFLLKILPDTETPLAYATFFGGTRSDIVTAIAWSEDKIYLSGYTASQDFAITFDAYQSSPGSIFLARLDLAKPGLDALEYATYLGGEDYDEVRTLALDAEGMIWLGGYTFSTRFPVTFPGYQVSHRGNADVFALRFNYSQRSNVGAIAYGTYAGGSDGDVLYGMTVLSGGRIALVGYTYSKDFPATETPRSASAAVGASGAFALIIDPARIAGEGLIYSAVFDSAYTDVAIGAVNDGGNLLICGYTTSLDFPVTDSSTKPSAGGYRSTFLLRAGPGTN